MVEINNHANISSTQPATESISTSAQLTIQPTTEIIPTAATTIQNPEAQITTTIAATNTIPQVAPPSSGAKGTLSSIKTEAKTTEMKMMKEYSSDKAYYHINTRTSITKQAL